MKAFKSLISNIVLATTLLAVVPVPTLALPLQIFDCNGVSRASKDVSANAKSEVKIDVTSNSGQVADGTQVTLTNSESGEVLTASAVNGTVTFPAVATGSWVLGSSVSNLLFESVFLVSEISAVAAGGAAVAAGVVGGGAVAGGVVIVDDQINDNNDNPAPTPTPIPDPTIPPNPTIDPLCPDCDSDDDADEIDNFFDAKKEEEKQALKDKEKANKSSATNCLNDKEIPPMSQFD